MRKGQHSWNISVMKEARVDLKVVLELSAECPFRGIFVCPILFFCSENNLYSLNRPPNINLIVVQ